MREDRTSVWRVTSGAALAYYAVFSLQVVAGAAVIILSGSLSEPTLPMRAVELLQKVGQLSVGAAAVSFILVDGGAGIMVLTQKFREKLRNEGREEGREEERKAWVDWNERRTRAMEEGREFSEPPPNGK